MSNTKFVYRIFVRYFCLENYLDRDVVEVIFGLFVVKFIGLVVVDVPPLDDTETLFVG